MHTKTLDVEMFPITIDNKECYVDSVFPDWDRHDRFGIVIHEAWGAVGASLLIQSTIAEFFRARQKAGIGDIYPEIYAFHVGKDHGDLSVYDFWPYYKEVVVENDPVSVLHALNQRGITRLAVPVGATKEVEFLWPEVIAVEDRTRTVVGYSADGRTPDADIVIRSSSAIAAEQTSEVLDIAPAIAKYKDSDLPDNIRWIKIVSGRLASMSPEDTQRAIKNHALKTQNGVCEERYRRVDVKYALARLVP